MFFGWCPRKPVADIFVFFSKRTKSFRPLNFSDIAFLHSCCCAGYMSSDNLNKKVNNNLLQRVAAASEPFSSINYDSCDSG